MGPGTLSRGMGGRKFLVMYLGRGSGGSEISAGAGGLKCHICFRNMMGEMKVSFRKKCLSFWGRGGEGGKPPESQLLMHFQFLFTQTYRKAEFPFLDQDQEFIIFFSGCWNLSANLFIGFIFLVRNVQ